jgi:hypothetical protein
MLASWLENLYGIWFLPEQAFARLREQPVLGQAALAVALISAVDGARQTGGNPAGVLAMIVAGWVAWISLSGLLWVIGFCLGRFLSLPVLLTVMGFAGLPWLLVAPALALGSPWGSMLAVAVVVWWLSWQLWAMSVAFDLPWWRLAGLIPLAFVGAFVALNWVFGGGATLLTLA